MAELISMKRPKHDPEKAMRSTAEIAPSMHEEYGYGLQVRLENFELKKLGIDAMPRLGKQYKLVARVKVESAHESVSRGHEGEHKDRSIQLQITELALMPADAEEGDTE